MKLYGIYIKSHSMVPDYEEELMAPNMKVAQRYFLKQINKGGGDWGIDDIKKHIGVIGRAHKI